MNVVFYSAFFNTALIPILTNANCKYVASFRKLKFLPDSNYSDFDDDWYATVGTLIFRTLCIQAFMPYITTLLVDIGILRIYRWIWDPNH